MKTNIKVASMALLFTLQAAAAELAIQLDPARSSVQWSLGAALHTVHGTFKLKSGNIRVDPASGQASGQLVVDLTSGESGNDTRDRRMHKEVLESAKYPDAVFTLDKIGGSLNPQGESKVQAHGMLAIHGSKHDITFPATVNVNGKAATGTSTFPIPYVAWGMKDPSNFLLKVKDSVTLEMQLVGTIQ